MEIYEIEQGGHYVTKQRKVMVRVLGFCKHAMDCSIIMVRYVNLHPTDDSPAGTEWVLEYSLFLKRFTEVN